MAYRKTFNFSTFRKFAILAYPAIVIYGLIFLSTNSSSSRDYLFHLDASGKERKFSDGKAQMVEFHGVFSNVMFNISAFFDDGKMFQNVSRDGLAMVFSAYLDDAKNIDKIRAIGVKKRSYDVSINCILWFKFRVNKSKENTYYKQVNGYVTEHPENFERSWSQVHYLCPFDRSEYSPFAVSIVPRDTDRPINVVKIQYTADSSFHNYTICLHNAFNFRMNVSTQIVEWIEVNRILGAEHFMIYNYSSHASNDAILNWYKYQGVITVIPWDIPTNADLIFLGQVAVMTDCLYRNFYSSLLISHLDIDEFIVPRRPKVVTVPALVSSLPRRCAYIARNNVFSLSKGVSETGFKEKALAEQYKLNTLLVRNKQNYIWKSTARSKLILRPACIEAAGVHLVNSYTSFRSEMTFDPTDALLHHYRQGRPKFVNRGERIGDDFMLKYAHNLTRNVARIWHSINTFNSNMH